MENPQILIYCFINTPVARIDNVSFVYTLPDWMNDVNKITDQDIEELIRNQCKLNIEIIDWELK